MTASARRVSANKCQSTCGLRTRSPPSLARCAETIVQCDRRRERGVAGRAARLVLLGGAAALVTLLLHAAVRSLLRPAPARHRSENALNVLDALSDFPLEPLPVVAGSRYVSWLPSFSVEVTRVRPPPPQRLQLDAMARQVHAMFPQYPLADLLRDLADTRSPDLTVDNILEGRLAPPAQPTLDAGKMTSPSPSLGSACGKYTLLFKRSHLNGH